MEGSSARELPSFIPLTRLILLMKWMEYGLFMQFIHIYPIFFGHLLNFCCFK